VTPVQMDTRMSPLALRILAVLDDGEWRGQNDLIEEVQYTIPPGEAFRIGKQRYAGKGEDRRDMEDVIAAGRRYQTTTIINNLISNGRVERNTTKRNEHKELRLAQRLPQLYVVRDQEGTLKVYDHNGQSISVHVVDAWANSDDPEADAEVVKTIYNSIPVRMQGREEVQAVCRHLMNRYNVAAKMRSFLATTPKVETNPNMGDSA
jgi:hypothetical protein